MKILVTGGAGYIGTHVCVELLEAGYDIVVADNFSNSKLKALDRVREITGKQLDFRRMDIRDEDALATIFAGGEIEGVIHLAGLKSVPESISRPIDYYRNNLGGTLSLLETMERYGVRKLVFSSSATVYGLTETVPVDEDAPLSCTNPYGWTKLMLEQVLRDVAFAGEGWSIIALRYFNPVGAHVSGLIGEDPSGTPNNLMPYITRVALGALPWLPVYGNDYDTPDGTGVRDYIHVSDLATGHLSALDHTGAAAGIDFINLGTGQGYSVLELVAAFERVNGVEIPYKIMPRREGDVATCYADPSKAERLLGWKAKRTLEDMCRDSWNWQMKNPAGYVD